MFVEPHLPTNLLRANIARVLGIKGRVYLGGRERERERERETSKRRAMRDERRSTTHQSFTGLQRERERERATEGSNARTNKRQSKRGVRDRGTTNHACTAHRAPRTAHAPRKVSRSGTKSPTDPAPPQAVAPRKGAIGVLQRPVRPHAV